MARVHYAGTSNFEQSLDIYRPTTPGPHPVVVLVVGSAWLGHRSWIHAITSWWNSSGPKTIARAGAVCVCVRHRGAFVRPPPWFVAALVATIFWPAALVVLGLQLLLHLLARGAATHDEMLDDVMTALHWVRAQRSLGGGRIIFGGYSSGAHVAASLLQRPDLLKARGLPPPDQLCGAVFLLSGCLGITPLGEKRRWPTVGELLCRAIFGREAAAALPSPVETAERAPAVPHLLVGCRHEVFGLPLLRFFFCQAGPHLERASTVGRFYPM